MMKQLNHRNNSCSMISLSSLETPYGTKDFVICFSVSRFTLKWTSKFADTIENRSMLLLDFTPDKPYMENPLPPYLPSLKSIMPAMMIVKPQQQYRITHWVFGCGHLNPRDSTKQVLWGYCNGTSCWIYVYSHSRSTWVTKCKSLLSSICISLLSSVSSMCTYKLCENYIFIWNTFDANTTCDNNVFASLNKDLEIPRSGSSSSSFKILLCCSVES